MIERPEPPDKVIARIIGTAIGVGLGVGLLILFFGFVVHLFQAWF